MQGLPIRVRRPAEADFTGVLECLAAYRFHVLGAAASADPDFPADAILAVRNSVCVVDFDRRCWVAEHAGRILGFCCWDWHDPHQRKAKTVLLSVRHEARRLGAGHLLQTARQQEMQTAGAVEVHTWSDDPQAIDWYCRKFGYQRLEDQPIYHTLHLLTAGHQQAWGLHRGHTEYHQLAHLRLKLAA